MRKEDRAEDRAGHGQHGSDSEWSGQAIDASDARNVAVSVR